jgi:hypothetical protein
MSYCRFSSDDYQCDVYCYADVCGGFRTHVASVRFVLSGKLPPPVDKSDITAWLARHRAVTVLVKDCERVDIGLPYDGEVFNDDTAQEAADRLEMLKSTGYNVPQYAIDALRDEAD